ncbi:LuxR family transcriptional regulator [soil metagenome]
MASLAAAWVGREDTLDDLGRRCLATESGGLELVALTGPAGIGKTALLRALLGRFPGALWAQAAAWESDLRGGVLAQLLQADVITDPVIGSETLADRLRDAGARLLIIDNAEHADIQSLQTLSTMLRFHRELTVLVVVTGTAVPPPLADLTSTEIRLTGLGPREVADLAARQGRTLHPTMVGVLTKHTAGNPRDILALLDEVPAHVWSRPYASLPAPTHVRERVSQQLVGCDFEGRALVEALAILGDEATLADITSLAELEEPLSAADTARSAGLLTATGPTALHLQNRLSRAAIIDLMGFRRASELHRRASEIVTDPVRRLRHRVAATSTFDAELADEIDQLARHHGTEGSWSQAATLFRDAARLTSDDLLRDERLIRSVDALVAAGDCLAAGDQVPVVESMRETPLRNAVLAYLAVLRGRATEAQIRLARAWDIVNTEREPDTAALIAQRHVLDSLVRCRGTDVVTWADRALQLADSDSPAAIEAAAIRGLGLLAAGHPRRATAAYDTLSARVRHGAQAQRVMMGRGWVQYIRDDVDGARSSLETAVAAAGFGGSTRITLWALAWLARAQFSIGEWDRAMASVEHGRELADASGIVLITPLLEWTAAQIAALRGDWPAANAAVGASSVTTSDYEMMLIPTLLARAQIAEAEADYSKALRIIKPLARMAAGTSLQEPGYWPWPDLMANALVLDGQLDAADMFLRPHEQRAAARGHRSAQARLGYARGRLHGALGDLHAARRSFEASLELLNGLPLRYDTARVNFAYGQTLRRAGKRREADTVIGVARELYLSLGATTYVTRCDRELKAGGLHQVRGGRDEVSLTPQEEAVSSLVARGLSNREVAAELYVSPKTVQYHLTRIYAKLGVRSRSELAALRR